MQMNYVYYCPMCDKPEPVMTAVLDFFKATAYIAAHMGYSMQNGNDSVYKKDWRRELLSRMDIPGNDCYVLWVALEDDEEDYESELWQFDQGLRNYFNLKDGGTILLNISW